MAVYAVRTALLLASLIGYLQYFSRKIRVEFALGFVFSCIGSVLFLAGILNILVEASLLILCGGLFLLGFCLYSKYECKGLFSAATVFFCLGSIFFIFILYGRKFVHYDDFSHWALVVKSIISTDRFPTYKDYLITFDSYPLGSASFIYYFVTISGISAEWMQMFAQAVLMLGFAVALFAFADKIESVIFVALIVVFMLCGNISFLDLLVDTLLPVTAVSAVALCAYLRINKYSSKYYLYLLPYLTFLMSTKNSGLLFVVLVLLYASLSLFRMPNGKKVFSLLACCPFILFYLWSKHVELVMDAVITEGMQAKHSLNLDYFLQVFENKFSYEIYTIIGQFASRVISLSNLFLPFCLLTVLLIVFVYASKRDNRFEVLLILCMSLFSYLVYQAGTLLMYLFSMPTIEALGLASYDRYHSTILIFSVGVASIAVLFMKPSDIFRSSKHPRLLSCALLAVALICSYFTIRPRLEFFNREYVEYPIDLAKRERFEELIAEYSIPPESAYMIITEDGYNDHGLLYYLSVYLLDSSRLALCEASDLESRPWEQLPIEYLITLHPTEDISAFLSEAFGSADEVILLQPDEP